MLVTQGKVCKGITSSQQLLPIFEQQISLTVRQLFVLYVISLFDCDESNDFIIHESKIFIGISEL